jgi:acetoin utilization deacetylase AcuC-like enzyme
MYVSLHGDTATEYPYFWGNPSETGVGNGKGYNINIPLKKSTCDEEYLSTLKNVVDNVIRKYDPDYMVISLGVDTYEFDPVAGFKLTQSIFKKIGATINIGVKTLFVMEGFCKVLIC